MQMRALLLLACVGLAAAQCNSVFFSLPSIQIDVGSAAYLEYPADMDSPASPEVQAIALEFCELYLPESVPGPPTLGVTRMAYPDLTIRLPPTQLSDPQGLNITVCEGPTCRLYGSIECVPAGLKPCSPDAQGNIGNRNTGTNNIGSDNSGSGNMCTGCSGSNNVGDNNAGSNNLGVFNSGSSNVGSYNSGSNVICNNMTSSNVPFEACPPNLWGPFVPV